MVGEEGFKAMALVSTQVSCRKAFERVDSAALKDNFLKEVNVLVVSRFRGFQHLRAGNEIQRKEPPSQRLRKADCAMRLMMLNGPKAFGGVTRTRKKKYTNHITPLKPKKHFFI